MLIALGEGGAWIFERKRARRSTGFTCQDCRIQIHACHQVSSPCLFLWTLMAISFRRSRSLLPPKAAFLSLETRSISSNLSLSNPLPEEGASAGRSGESCLWKRGDTVGGGESSEGRKPSESGIGVGGCVAEKGEKGSTVGSCGGAGETQIAGTGERASMLCKLG